MLKIKRTSGQCFLHYDGSFFVDWPDSSVAIVGPNGSGKTTIARALVWSLIGKFPTPANISKYTMDLPRPGRYVGVKKSPDTLVSTEFDLITIDGSRVAYRVTRRLTWDKKITLTLESEDGVMKLSGQAAQNQIYLFSGVSHGSTADESAKLFLRKHWFGVDQDVSIFTASATQRRELLESTNPLALLPRMEDETVAAIKAEQKLLLETTKAVSSCVGSVGHVWGKIIRHDAVKAASSLDDKLPEALLPQGELDRDPASSIVRAREVTARVKRASEDLKENLSGLLSQSKDLVQQVSLFRAGDGLFHLERTESSIAIDRTKARHLAASLKAASEGLAAIKTGRLREDELRREISQLERSLADTETRLGLLTDALGSLAGDLAFIRDQAANLAPWGFFLRSDGARSTSPRLREVRDAASKLSAAASRLGAPLIRASRPLSRDILKAVSRELHSLAASEEERDGHLQSFLETLKGVPSAADLARLKVLLLAVEATCHGEPGVYDNSLLPFIQDAERVARELRELNESDAVTGSGSCESPTTASRLVAARQEVDEKTKDLSSIQGELQLLAAEKKRLAARIDKISRSSGDGACDECGSPLDQEHVASKKETIQSDIDAIDEATRVISSGELHEASESLRLAKIILGDAELLAREESARSAASRALRDEKLKQKERLHRIATLSLGAVLGAEELLSVKDEILRQHAEESAAGGRAAKNIMDLHGISTLRAGILPRDVSAHVDRPSGERLADVLKKLAGDIEETAARAESLQASSTEETSALIADASRGDISSSSLLTAIERLASEDLAKGILDARNDQTAKRLGLTNAQKALEDTSRDLTLTASKIGYRGLQEGVLPGDEVVRSLAQAAGIAALMEAMECGPWTALEDETAPGEEGAKAEGLEASSPVFLSILRAERRSQRIITLSGGADALLAMVGDVETYLSDADTAATVASEKSRKIEALSSLRTLLATNGDARTMVLASVAANAFDEANRSIKSLGLARDLHVGVEVVSLAKEGEAPQPALDITFSVDGQRANLPSNSQGLQVSLALDLAVQSQGGWGGFFVVDEPEQGLDSQTRGKINRWLRSLGRQVIILTNMGADNFDKVIQTGDIRTGDGPT